MFFAEICTSSSFLLLAASSKNKNGLKSLRAIFRCAGHGVLQGGANPLRAVVSGSGKKFLQKGVDSERGKA